MKDPPPVFSPASQSVTLPSLKSVEIHQAGNRGEQNDRSPLPSNIIIPRSWTRTELERRSLFSLLSASREGEALFGYRERNETKRKKERKKELKFIQRYYVDVDPRELIHALEASRSIVHGWTRLFHIGCTVKHDAKIWRVNESPNAPRIIAPLLIQIRERGSSPRRRAYCNTSFENSPLSATSVGSLFTSHTGHVNRCYSWM